MMSLGTKTRLLNPDNQPLNQRTNQLRHGGGTSPKGNWIRRPPQGCSCDKYQSNLCQFLQICNPPTLRVNTAQIIFLLYRPKMPPRWLKKSTFCKHFSDIVLASLLGGQFPRLVEAMMQ